MSSTDATGSTVGEVLDGLVDRFGSGFSEVLGISRVWRNGEPADATTPVESDDEIAVLPPVSGG